MSSAHIPVLEYIYVVTFHHLHSFITSPPPAWSLLDGVGEVDELQVHGWAFGQMGETLGFGDLVLNLLQVGQHGGLLLLLKLVSSITHYDVLHGETHRVRFQCLIVHTSLFQEDKGPGKGNRMQAKNTEESFFMICLECIKLDTNYLEQVPL